MKKRNRTKSIRLLITLMLMVCVTVGCSNAATQSEETTQPDTQVTVEEESTTVEEPEITEEETVAEETTVEEPEEVVEPEPEVIEDPGEVTYITDFATLGDYVNTLDPDQPAILIYNESEKYIINMQEGQHYELKSTDKIVYNSEEMVGYGWNFDLAPECISYRNYTIFTVDYSVWEEKQEFFLKKKLESGEIVQSTCYLTPPAE